MRPVLTAFALSFMLVAAASSGLAAPAGARGAVVVEGADMARFRDVAAALEAAGARLPHRFPPNLLVGTLPADLEARMPQLPGVSLRVERAGGPPLQGPAPRALGAARAFLRGGRDIPGLPEPRPLGGDHVEPLPGEEPAVAKALPSGDCGDHPSATSAYLVGSVAIGILLPESIAPSPDTETWSVEDTRFPGQDRQDLVVAEIMEGCDTLVATIPQAGLSFSYDVRRSIAIPYEPILHSVPDRGVWINAILDAIGHGAASSSFGTYGYVNELRDRFGADWAAAAYVADDLADADNGFPPTGFPFAYALLGGPYMVMTYDNDGWGISRMDVVFRHELGHVFGALDEYSSAGNTCSMTAGYLAVRNGNNASPPADTACVSAVTCVMRANATPDACAFSLGQMGIRDGDADGILDPRDAPPDSGFELDGPVLWSADSGSLAARASGTPLASESPFAPTWASINRIASAEMSLDGGPYVPLAAADGAFGGRCEDLQVDLAGLSEGWHDVRVRATNDVGMTEPTPALLRVYVNADCADDAAEPDDDAASARPRAVGVHPGFHCAYDADWSRFRLQAGASVTLTVRQADASGSLRLRLLDASLREIARADAVAGVATITATAAFAGTHHAVVEGNSEFETAYDLELVADCLDDPDEPATYEMLAPGSLPGRVLCAGDEDLYVIGLQAGESVAAGIAFDGTFGDLDLELLDPSGAVVSSSTGAGSSENVSAMPTSEGAYVVRVAGKTVTDRGVYDLVVAATGCTDDAGENDDDLASARPLAGGADARGVICADDEDWYAWDLTGRRLVRIRLDHDPAAGNLDLELRTDAGMLVARSSLPGGSELIASERLRPGSYRVRVLGTGTGRVPYRLRLDDVDPLLLFVRKDPSDAILSWNLSGYECFTVRRSLVPSDFTSAVETPVNEGDPSVPDGDRPIGDLAMRDRGVIGDGVRLYCYLVDPHDCGASLVGSVKTAEPYPIVPPGIGTVPSVVYTITVTNDGVEDSFGTWVEDDVPSAASTFTVLEIPPGATDLSQPPPAGANGRGQVRVAGFTVPAGEQRVVRYRMDISFNLAFDNPLVTNQAHLRAGDGPSGSGEIWPTDDPATTAFPDATRVFVINSTRGPVVSAFWHRDVDLDVRVIDPCGNVLSEHDLVTATCGGMSGTVGRTSSCAAPGSPGAFEQIRFSWPAAPGDYRVEVSYPGSLPGDPDCGGAGPDDVTVVYQSPTIPYEWRTLTVSPGEPGAFVFTMTQ